MSPVALHTHNPECLKWILKDNFNNYVKGEELCTILHGLVGNGIFAADGAVWKSQRQIASNLFSVKEMKEMIPGKKEWLWMIIILPCFSFSFY